MSKIYSVINTNPKGHLKNLTLKGEGASVSLRVHRFAAVGKGDLVRFGAAGTNKLFVVAKHKNENAIPLTPLFSWSDSILIGKDKLSINIREINTDADMRGWDFLEQFHYKTNTSLEQRDYAGDEKGFSTSVGGRRAILYADIQIGENWFPAAYVDLQMPLMMCKPRHVLFNEPFQHTTRAIHWDCWDQQAMKNYLNTIVRIGRIVVSPEYRGLGMTRKIIQAAKTYAADRWHIGGMRPIFMEISAEMLTHIDFVSSSGFKFIGRTEGNLSRVIKDMEQMARSPGGDFGIMSLQRKYFRVLEDYCNTIQISFEEGIETLRRKIEQNRNGLSTAEWAMLRSVIRNPIPYYLCPLDEYTAEYLRRALKSSPPKIEGQSNTVDFKVKSTQINLNGLSIRAAYNIPQTRSTRIIMDSFGLKGDTVYSDIVKDLSVKASNGNIILVAGSSGSGKSVFLDALDPNKSFEGNLMVKQTENLKHSAGWLLPLRNDVSVFEALANKATPQRAFIALSRVGLSEALSFIKPYWMLSRGQQYRAMIADLLLREEEVWLLDEFCSDLDPLTAKIVAHNLRKQIISTGRIAFVGAANHVHFLDALRPTRVLYLRTGDQPAWLTFREYQSGVLDQVV